MLLKTGKQGQFPAFSRDCVSNSPGLVVKELNANLGDTTTANDKHIQGQSIAFRSKCFASSPPPAHRSVPKFWARTTQALGLASRLAMQTSAGFAAKRPILIQQIRRWNVRAIRLKLFGRSTIRQRPSSKSIPKEHEPGASAAQNLSDASALNVGLVGVLWSDGR